MHMITIRSSIHPKTHWQEESWVNRYPCWNGGARLSGERNQGRGGLPTNHDSVGYGRNVSILHLSIASVSIETEIVKTESRLPKEMWKKTSVPQKAKMNATKPSGTIEDASTRQLANLLTQNEPQVPLNLKECLIPKDICFIWYLYQRNIQTYRSAKRGCPRHEASFRRSYCSCTIKADQISVTGHLHNRTGVE